MSRPGGGPPAGNRPAPGRLEAPHTPQGPSPEDDAIISGLATPWLLAAILAAGAVILVVSIRMTALADTIADRAGWGEALVGGVVLGAATSLSGLVVSGGAALSGDASLAFANGVGGIAAQTAFIAVADIWHRRANLEHAAAEPANLFQAAMLMILLSLPVLAWASPEMTVLGVHPVTIAMLAAYVLGLRYAARVRERPLWRPVDTEHTRIDEPEDEQEASRSVRGPAIRFAALAAILGVSGWVLGQAGATVVTRFGLSSSLVGALMTAVITSLPELVTTLAAVRRGALQLAVGGIIGGNTFDTLFLVVSDGLYRDGSLFHAVGRADLFWLATALAMTAVLMAGLVLRQPKGPGGIGIESVTLLGLYGAAVALQAVSG